MIKLFETSCLKEFLSPEASGREHGKREGPIGLFLIVYLLYLSLKKTSSSCVRVKEHARKIEPEHHMIFASPVKRKFRVFLLSRYISPENAPENSPHTIIGDSENQRACRN